MRKKYVLTTPLITGDWPNQVTITELRLVAFSFNIQQNFVGGGVAGSSFLLADQNNAHHLAFHYEDAQTLAFAEALDRGNFSLVSLTEQIFTKLQTIPDSAGKTLPPGTIV